MNDLLFGGARLNSLVGDFGLLVLRAELAYLFLAIAFMFALVGAGRFSLDRLIEK